MSKIIQILAAYLFVMPFFSDGSGRAAVYATPAVHASIVEAVRVWTSGCSGACGQCQTGDHTAAAVRNAALSDKAVGKAESAVTGDVRYVPL
jgi:hypothetical protein